MVPSCVEETFHVPFGLPAEWQKCFHLSSHKQTALLHSPEKRLDSISISRGDKQLSGLIEEDTGKLAPQVMDETESVQLIQCYYELRVRSTLEMVVGLFFDLFANVVVVVEFSVYDGMNLPLGIGEWLTSVG